MFSKDEIYELARRQSAVDLNCNPDDFRGFENKVVISKSSPAARRYLELPFLCNIARLCHFLNHFHHRPTTKKLRFFLAFLVSLGFVCGKNNRKLFVGL